MLCPDTYGNPDWVKRRCSDIVRLLGCDLSPRTSVAERLLSLLGIGPDNSETLQGVIFRFQSVTDQHKALGVVLATTVVLFDIS